jgi:hypothetical protein
VTFNGRMCHKNTLYPFLLKTSGACSPSSNFLAPRYYIAATDKAVGIGDGDFLPKKHRILSIGLELIPFMLQKYKEAFGREGRKEFYVEKS